MRDDRGRLVDILEAIEKIETRTGGGRKAFDADEMIQVWVVHHLQILGEAANMLTEKLLEDYPNASWRKMIGMRHILVHHYFEIDHDVVWDVVENSLPVLKDQINMILDDLGRP